MKGRGNIEMRGRDEAKGERERELVVVGLKRKWDFLPNIVLKPTALNKYTRDCVPSAPAAYGIATKTLREYKSHKKQGLQKQGSGIQYRENSDV